MFNTLQPLVTLALIGIARLASAASLLQLQHLFDLKVIKLYRSVPEKTKVDFMAQPKKIKTPNLETNERLHVTA